ncbi:BA75_03111T0 [Komagataella pastoris]|uniref:BA75_03111T0 n=1 Tax=Komagataella pastoris TaxID=4922 RepID=A0A1B2JBD9_PICPA|nr:BA75_03111T0 [Komagataella pastoris]
MNFLAKTVASLSGGFSSIPYNFGDVIVTGVENDIYSNSIWNVYKGTSKADKTVNCSIFMVDTKSVTDELFVDMIGNAFKFSKVLKLPGVLNVLHASSNDSQYYIVTEQALPLDKYLSQNDLTSEQLLFGLYNISEALKFINVEGATAHCNVNRHSIFVTESGEWKLFGFELATNAQNISKSLVPMGFRLPSFKDTLAPPEYLKDSQTCVQSLVQAIKIDAWQLGVLTYELFNDVKMTDSSLMNSFTKIPKNLVPYLRKLLSPSIASRCSPQQFFEVGTSTFFKSPLVEMVKILNEFSLAADHEKLAFFQNLQTEEITPPSGFLENKVLPHLLTFFKQTTQENKPMLLHLILKLSLTIPKERFTSQIKPVILEMIHVPDRSIRMTLLTTLPLYVEKLDKQDINNRFFTAFLTGFNDSNVAIREETIKSSVLLAPFLNERPLNNELLRYLAKTQMDEAAEIRSTTIICLNKIASHLSVGSRSNVLIIAFSKSIRDPHIPSRLNALTAFNDNIDLFTPEECCSRVLSAIAPLLLDKFSTIRSECDRVFRLYMEKIEKAAKEIPDDTDDAIELVNDEINKQENLKEQIGSFGDFGWSALTNITNKIGGTLNTEVNQVTPGSSQVHTPTLSFTNLPSQVLQTTTSKASEDDSWNFDMEKEPSSQRFNTEEKRPQHRSKPMTLGKKSLSLKTLSLKPNADKPNTKISNKMDENAWDVDNDNWDNDFESGENSIEGEEAEEDEGWGDQW